MSKINVVVWNEFRHEKIKDSVRELYPNGLHATIKSFLDLNEDMSVTLAALDDPDQGLPDSLLDNTDVLMWWGHMRHGDVDDGLVKRIAYDVVPPKVSYELTDAGKRLMPILDSLYIWAVRRMDELDMPIDQDAFVVHKSKKYTDALRDVMENYEVPDEEVRDYRSK